MTPSPWKGYRWFCFDCASPIKGDPSHAHTGCLSTHFAMVCTKVPKRVRRKAKGQA